MKKKIIPVLLFAAMVLTLAGCGGSSEGEEEASTQEELEESDEEESVVDQVEEFRYDGTEDHIAFWSIDMKEGADYDDYYEWRIY